MWFPTICRVWIGEAALLTAWSTKKATARALAFVLRERNDRPPSGLCSFYTKREYGFEAYDERFLSKCARIVSLTVGRRVAVARDTLEKAAGAMAHYGQQRAQRHAQSGRVLRRAGGGHRRQPGPRPAPLARVAGRISRRLARPLPGVGAGKHSGPRRSHGTGRGIWAASWKARGA